MLFTDDFIDQLLEEFSELSVCEEVSHLILPRLVSKILDYKNGFRWFTDL